MYFCMWVCMFVCMHACLNACMYACMHACAHACTYVCRYLCFPPLWAQAHWDPELIGLAGEPLLCSPQSLTAKEIRRVARNTGILLVVLLRCDRIKELKCQQVARPQLLQAVNSYGNRPALAVQSRYAVRKLKCQWRLGQGRLVGGRGECARINIRGQPKKNNQVSMHACMCVCVRLWVYACMHVCMYGCAIGWFSPICICL